MTFFFRRPHLVAALHYSERSSAPCNVAQRIGGNGGEGRRRPEAGEAAVTKGCGTTSCVRSGGLMWPAKNEAATKNEAAAKKSLFFRFRTMWG